MRIAWERVITNPLGLTGFALFLVFGAVTLVLKQRKPTQHWIPPFGFALALLCVFGGLFLAYRNQPAPSPPPATTQPTPAPSMSIGNVNQRVKNGNAVTGVQGNVTITPNHSPR